MPRNAAFTRSAATRITSEEPPGTVGLAFPSGANRGEPVEDLAQAALLGLVKAINRGDVTL